LVLARRRITLPVPVSLKRFAVPLWVFIFGMVAVVSSSVHPGGARFFLTWAAAPGRAGPAPGTSCVVR
jgi:hypothetical protein